MNNSEKRKICIIVRGLTLGGVRRFVINILSEIDKLNYFEIHLVHDEISFENKFKNIQTHYINTKNKFLFDYVYSFRLLYKLNLDIIIYPKNVISLMHFFLKGRKINIVHDLGYFEPSIEAYPFWDTLFMKAFMKVSCIFSSKIFAVSESTKKDIVRRFKIKDTKIAVIQEGVEKNFTVIKDKNKLDFTLKKYGIKGSFLFYAGSVNPRKNLMRVLRAFNKIKKEIPHQLVITGNIMRDVPEFEDYVEKNLQGRVQRLGFIKEEELINMYNSADAYIFPSLYEGFGLPILEAQACGCPVLTSNVTSCPEVAGEGALIVNPYSVKDIQKGIEFIVKDEKLRSNLIQKGFENVEKFSWHNCVRNILEQCALDEQINHNASAHDKAFRFYNIKHSEIYNNVEQTRLRELISDLVKRKKNKKVKVLDVGAGTGNLSLKFLENNCEVTASDVSKKSLELLKKLSGDNDNLKLALIKNKSLPFKDNEFDIVGTYSVLHHIPDYLFTVKEMIRVCKPNGFIYIDHEGNENRWGLDEKLSEYNSLTKQTKIEHLKKLFKTRELFTFDFFKTVFVKIFINKRYEREGDIHVWKDDHIEWGKIKKVFKEYGCKIVEEVDYLMYKPKGSHDNYKKYKQLTNDTKYIVVKK